MLKDLNNKQLQVLVKTIGVYVGLFDAIDPLTQEILNNFLVRHYPNKTAEDIMRAFNLYASQELDYKKGVYNNLNPTFIGRIMASFKEYERKEATKPKALPPTDLKQLEYNPNEGKESYDNILSYVEKGQEPFIANYIQAYKYIEQDLGYIFGQEELDSAAKWVRIDEARANARKGDKGTTLNIDLTVEVQAKKRLVIRYVKTHL